jgi:hypothetical protein
MIRNQPNENVAILTDLLKQLKGNPARCLEVQDLLAGFETSSLSAGLKMSRAELYLKVSVLCVLVSL